MIGHLQQLHEQHGDKGLVMLGVNVTDSKSAVAAFLSSYGVTFPNIADQSQEARFVVQSKYQSTRGGVPLEYIIDRDGKVVRGWYGSGGNIGENLIRQLGVQ